jgi:nicotinate-nucleotide pyrophosphorylase (carboxylating)
MKPSFKRPSYPVNFNRELDLIITRGLQEDLGEGDHTTLATIPKPVQATGKLLVKAEGVIAGVSVAERIFQKVDRKIKVQTLITDGAQVKKGDIVFTVHGSARSLLSAERLVLNCMQRMSGIATQAQLLTRLCKGTKATVIDTRKTTPGIRLLEKWAVAAGGAQNHRYGLFDMILIKDNHIDCSGGITQAITRAQAYLKRRGKKMDIEIEARSIAEVKEVMQAGGVKTILLDNLTPANTAKAVKIIGGRFLTEASGGITEKNIRAYALTGVDYISTGALTHSVKNLDLSLKIHAENH